MASFLLKSKRDANLIFRASYKGDIYYDNSKRTIRKHGFRRQSYEGKP